MTVSVVEMTNGISMHRWSCAACIESRRATGWTVKVGREVPGGRCADCELARQAAPGYVTPSVAFAPTAPGSHLPTRTEVARMPGCKPMAPWPAPTAKPRPKRAEAA